MPLTAHGEQSALRSHRTPNAAASTASHPASLTIRIRPSVGRDARVLELIWVRWQQIFFGKSEIKDSTALSTNRPTGKSLEPVLLSTPSVFRINASCKAPIEDVGWVEPAKPIISINAMMGIAEFIIGRAFARPVGQFALRAADVLVRRPSGNCKAHPVRAATACLVLSVKLTRRRHRSRSADDHPLADIHGKSLVE